MNTNDGIFPFSYFQDLLESDKSQILIKKFVSDFLKNSDYHFIKVNEIKGEFTYHGQYYDNDGNPGESDEIIYDFKSYFEICINHELIKTKHLINQKNIQLLDIGQPIDEYLKTYRTILTNLEPLSLRNYSNYPFIKDAIINLSRYLAQLDDFGFVNQTHNNNSFCWDNDDSEKKRESIINLYRLTAIEKKLIEGTSEDFINAFSNGEVKHGLKWMDTTTNGDNCKTSLIYFINKLQEENFIFDSNGKAYNDKICYVFRDSEGKLLENIKNSKSKQKTNSYQYDVIDDIIDHLSTPV